MAHVDEHVVTPRRLPVRPSGSGVWAVATLLAVAPLIAVTVWNAPSALRAPWDTVILLDGSHRILDGQSPGADFGNPIGVIVYGLSSLGMRMQDHPSLAGVSYGVALFATAVACLAWWVFRARLGAAWAVLGTVYIVLVSCAVRPLGFSPSVLSYAMLYNRFGWALLTVVGVLVLIPARRVRSRATVIVDGVLLGLLLALLVHIKASFFVGGVLLVAVAVVARRFRFRRRPVVAGLVAFVVVNVVVVTVFRVDMPGYLADIVAAGRSQSAGTRARAGVTLVRDAIPAIAACAVAAVVLLTAARRRGRTARQPFSGVAVAAAVGALAIFVSVGNAMEHADIPLLFAVPLVLWRESRSAAICVRDRWGWRRILVDGVIVVALAVVALPIVVKDGDSIIQSSQIRLSGAQPVSQQIASGPMRDMIIPADADYATSYRESRDVPAMFTDGLSLLQRHIAAHDTVLTLALTDPFSFTLGTPSVRGPLWWDLNFDFDREEHPAAQSLFRRVTWVMIPVLRPGEGCCQDTVTTMREIYADYLAAHFHQVEATGEWILLGRNDVVSPRR